MWSTFRAIAEQIGLSPAKVEEVERSGVETYVEHPLNSMIQIRVRPDADWTERLSDAWNGTLVNSRREVAGTIPIGDGLLTVTNADAAEGGVTLQVLPGEYEVTLVVAHEGEEEDGDYEEHISHAFALLRNAADVKSIELLVDDTGTEIDVAAHTVAFATHGVFPDITGDHAGRWTLKLLELFHSKLENGQIEHHTSVKLASNDGSGAAVVFRGGYQSSDYPIFKLIDEEGRTVGVIVDFFVDNRP